VTIVVPVLMMNCHVSEYSNIGPVENQTRITTTAVRNAHEEPTISEVLLEAAKRFVHVVLLRTETTFAVRCNEANQELKVKNPLP
jgi:hypothetical protein